LDVRAKARTYLRGKCKNNGKCRNNGKCKNSGKYEIQGSFAALRMSA